MKRIKQVIWALRYWLAISLMGTSKKQYMAMVQKAMVVDLASFANPSFDEAMKRCADGIADELIPLQTLEYVFARE